MIVWISVPTRCLVLTAFGHFDFERGVSLQSYELIGRLNRFPLEPC